MASPHSGGDYIHNMMDTDVDDDVKMSTNMTKGDGSDSD